MPLKARVWSLGKLLLLVGALAGTFLLFALVSMRVALRARDVAVPNLVGATIENATLTVNDLGLALRVDPNKKPDERVAAGGIVQQEPLPGVTARRQRSIRVWISSGPRATTVPGLVGQNERTARMRVDEEGLEVAAVSEFRSPDYPADAVVAQDPAPSSRAPSAAGSDRRSGGSCTRHGTPWTRSARRSRYRSPRLAAPF